MSQPGILTLHIKEKEALQQAYMPFVSNGGLFVPTAKPYELGDEVFILLTLLEDTQRLPVAAKVVWVTPTGAQNQRTAGIGVQFSAQDHGETQKRIETALAGMPEPKEPTNTF